MPLTIPVTGFIIAILTAEFYGKSVKGNPVFFLGIAFGFFNFSNEARLHYLYLLKLKSTAFFKYSARILSPPKSWLLFSDTISYYKP